MGRLLEAALILACICVVAYFLAARYYAVRGRRRKALEPYRLAELTVVAQAHRGGRTSCRQVAAVKGQEGDYRELIKIGRPIPIDDPQFDMRIEFARSQAQVKIIALNSGRRLNR